MIVREWFKGFFGVGREVSGLMYGCFLMDVVLVKMIIRWWGFELYFCFLFVKVIRFEVFVCILCLIILKY